MSSMNSTRGKKRHLRLRYSDFCRLVLSRACVRGTWVFRTNCSFGSLLGDCVCGLNHCLLVFDACFFVKSLAAFDLSHNNKRTPKHLLSFCCNCAYRRLFSLINNSIFISHFLEHFYRTIFEQIQDETNIIESRKSNKMKTEHEKWHKP